MVSPETLPAGATSACAETSEVASATFGEKAEETVPDTGDCFRAVVVAAWWHWAGTIAAVGHSFHNRRAHWIVYCVTFDVLLMY